MCFNIQKGFPFSKKVFFFLRIFFSFFFFFTFVPLLTCFLFLFFTLPLFRVLTRPLLPLSFHSSVSLYLCQGQYTVHLYVSLSPSVSVSLSIMFLSLHLLMFVFHHCAVLHWLSLMTPKHWASFQTAEDLFLIRCNFIKVILPFSLRLKASIVLTMLPFNTKPFHPTSSHFIYI